MKPLSSLPAAVKFCGFAISTMAADGPGKRLKS